MPFFKGHTIHPSVEARKRSGIKNSRLLRGRKLSDLTKQKISRALKGRHPKEHYRQIGYLGVLKQSRTKGLNSLEKIVRDALVDKGVSFKTQELINGKFLVDFYLPTSNSIIEVDGDYWHSLDRVVKKDKAENAYLNKCGYKLFRWSEKEIKNNVDILINRLES